MRSAASLGHPIFICLLVIATVTFHQCVAQTQIPRWSDFEMWPDYWVINVTHISETEREPFLIGERTPVWLATESVSGPIFRRYDIPERYSGELVAREALEYYFEVKDTMDFRYRIPSWRIGAYHRAAKAAGSLNANNSDAECVEENNSDSEQSTSVETLKIATVSMLVILDFQELPKLNATNVRAEVAKRITYPQAFWNMVNIKLNDLIKPAKLAIRIAGIIFAEEPNAFEAWTSKWKPTLQDTLDGIKDSFDSPTWTNQFPRESYDFVAYMTSASVGGSSPYIPQGASSWRVPCTDENHPIGDIMIWDNFSFMGMDGAVQELINVLSPKKLEHRINLIPRTVWTASTDLKPFKCAIRRVSKFLPTASCLSKPKEYFPPGRPIRSILPGQMLSLGQYCGNFGYTQKADSSRLANGCTQMQCGYQYLWWRWDDMGRALDGTSCSSSSLMMCVEGGRCVPNDSMDIEANRFLPVE